MAALLLTRSDDSCLHEGVFPRTHGHPPFPLRTPSFCYQATAAGATAPSHRSRRVTPHPGKNSTNAGRGTLQRYRALWRQTRIPSPRNGSPVPREGGKRGGKGAPRGGAAGPSRPSMPLSATRVRSPPPPRKSDHSISTSLRQNPIWSTTVLPWQLWRLQRSPAGAAATHCVDVTAMPSILCYASIDPC